MNAIAARSLDLMRKMRRLYEQGSHSDALALYRSLEPTWIELEHRNLWEGDTDRTCDAIEVLVWMVAQRDLPPFRTDWPEWLTTWIITAQRPVKLLKPLTFLRRDDADTR